MYREAKGLENDGIYVAQVRNKIICVIKNISSQIWVYFSIGDLSEFN